MLAFHCASNCEKLSINKKVGATIDKSQAQQSVKFWVFSTYIDGPVDEEDMLNQQADHLEIVDPESAPNDKETEILKDQSTSWGVDSM